MSKEAEFNRIVGSIYQIKKISDITTIRSDIKRYSEYYEDSAGTIDLSKHLKERIDNIKLSKHD